MFVVIANLIAAVPISGIRMISIEMTPTAIPNHVALTRRHLDNSQIAVVRAVFFAREDELRRIYLDCVSDRTAETAHWTELILKNQPSPAAIFYFLRWLDGENWFKRRVELYRASRHWQSRLLCIGAASGWTRERDDAFELVINGLEDKSIEVVLSSMRGCAYSLRHEAIPYLDELKVRLIGKNGPRHREADRLIGNTLAAIRTQNHHRFVGESPNVGLNFWPWDESTMSMARLDLDWHSRVLHRSLGERLAELGLPPLPEFVRVELE